MQFNRKQQAQNYLGRPQTAFCPFLCHCERLGSLLLKLVIETVIAFTPLARTHNA